MQNEEKPMRKYLCLILLLTVGLGSGIAQQVGTEAPDFTHSTLSHGTISLSDFRGKVVYLFFFGWG